MKDREAPVLGPRGMRLAKIVAVLLGGSFVGHLYEPLPWYFWPIFCAVIVIWRARSLEDLLSSQSGAFLLAGLVVAGLVALAPHQYELVQINKVVYPRLGVGTILLLAAHALVLKASWRRVLVACLGVYVVWLLVGGWALQGLISLGTLTHRLVQGGAWSFLKAAITDFSYTITWLLNPVTIWLAVYLLFMFGRLPAKKRQ